MIRRGKHQANYSVLPNAALNDSDLSFEARGLLVYLLSKPENWVVRVADLCREGRVGRDKCRRILNELEATGYLQREQRRCSDGRMNGVDCVVYDTRDEVPGTENTSPENPHPEPEEPETENPDTAYPAHTKEPLSTNPCLVERTDDDSPKKKPSSSSTGHRLPDNWEPSDKLRAWAKSEEGLSEFEVRRETEKFRDHWHDKTGKDATKKSWDGTFRNWIRKGRDWRKPKGDGDKTAAELSPMPKYESQPGEDYSHLLAPMPGEPGYDEWREKQGLPPYEPLPFERHDLP